MNINQEAKHSTEVETAELLEPLGFHLVPPRD